MNKDVVTIWLFGSYQIFVQLTRCSVTSKKKLLLCISKWLRRETLVAQSGRDRKPCWGVSQQSTQSRSSRTMAKGSTDVQAVVERLLWIVTDCRMPFKGLLRIASRKRSRSTSLSTTACTSVETFAIVHALLDRVDDCETP